MCHQLPVSNVIVFGDPPNHGWFHHTSSREMTTKHFHPKLLAIFTKLIYSWHFFPICCWSWYMSGSRWFTKMWTRQWTPWTSEWFYDVLCNLYTPMWSYVILCDPMWSYVILCPYFLYLSIAIHIGNNESPTNPAEFSIMFSRVTHSIGSSISQALDSTSSWLDVACAKWRFHHGFTMKHGSFTYLNHQKLLNYVKLSGSLPLYPFLSPISIYWFVDM